MKKNNNRQVTSVTFNMEHEESLKNPVQVLCKWLFPNNGTLKDLPDGVITIKVDMSSREPVRPIFKDRREEIHMTEVKPFEAATKTAESTVTDVVTKCSKHPFYTGQRKQRTECTECEKVYATFQAAKKSKSSNSGSAPQAN